MAIWTLMTILPVTAALGGPDFDGDGFDDLAIGVPGEKVGTALEAGAVNVIYGTAAGLAVAGNKVWHQNSANVLDSVEAGDRFGSALAWGDFDGDGFDDLAIGIEGEDISGKSNAGAVCILYGSAAGLASGGNQFWHQNSTGILESCEAGDQFGESLAAGDFDGDGFDDLAIGAPGEKVGTAVGAGAVHVLFGSAAGLSASGDQLWTQDSTGVLDQVEPSDEFGDSLAAGDFDGDGFDDLVIGVDEEDVGTVDDAGAVHVLYGSAAGPGAAGDQFFTQDSPGIADDPDHDDNFGDALAVGDFNDDGFDDLAIAADREEVGAVTDAGAVFILYGSAAGLSGAGSQLWHQNIAGIIDAAAASEHFGADIAAGDFDGDGFDDLAIGVESENVGTKVGAGAVNVVYGSAAGLAAGGNQIWHQDSTGVLESAAAGEGFGDAVLAADFNGDGRADLAVGTENEKLGTISGAGAVNVLYGSGAGLTANGDQLWHQDVTSIAESAEANDHFGSVL
jgi:disulfide bond formation protein DsbB